MVYKKLSELTTRGHTWNIKVKVMRLWDSVNSATDELLICNDLKITFMYNTKVKQVKETAESFPEYYFDFASIDTLQDRANKDQHLSDVIGLLTRMKPIETRMTRKNTPNPRLAEIREIELLLLGLTLWGQLARFFSEDVIGNQTVVIVTSTTVQEYIGQAVPREYIQIYTYVRRETWTLIDRQFSEETIPKMMEVDKSTQGTREEQMFYNRKTLKDITEMRHGNPGSQLRLIEYKKIFNGDGKNDEIPNIIQQLCGKQLIFKFKLSEQNLTEGTPNYVVKRTFVPDYMLEKQYLINKAEEELMDDDVDNILKQDRETDQQEQTSRGPLIKKQIHLTATREARAIG
uniref:DUF223 domain-containing protein n=1 Tax=Oryza nivara TaxID=4536 RepID=A0A0E0H358_ORYNI